MYKKEPFTTESSDLRAGISTSTVDFTLKQNTTFINGQRVVTDLRYLCLESTRTTLFGTVEILYMNVLRFLSVYRRILEGTVAAITMLLPCGSVLRVIQQRLCTVTLSVKSPLAKKSLFVCLLVLHARTAMAFVVYTFLSPVAHS